jgi:hypothetical protein
MAISIDRVYQKVLAIANKEQRGYITPQEFNLFSDQAQLDIFEQYIYDINQFERVKGNDTEYSDMLSLLDEKLSIFKRIKGLTYNTDGYHQLRVQRPYLISSMFFEDIAVLEVSNEEYILAKKSLILKPTIKNPVYVQRENRIYLYPNEIISDASNDFAVKCNYIEKPSKPEWSYIVVNNEALYEAGASNDFELHPSEENNLINKILQLAGINMGNELYQVASQEEVKDIQQEKS